MEESAKAVFSSKIMQNNDEGWCNGVISCWWWCWWWWWWWPWRWHDNDDIKDTFQSFNIQILQCHHIQNQTRFRLPGSFCFLWWGLPCRTHQLADFLLTTRFLSMSIVWAQSIVLQCDRKIKESILVKWPGRIGILTIAHNILEYLWHFFEILNSASLCLKCCYSVTYIWRFFSQIDREGSSH